jgi:membrane protease YdiL (CAAX protease family)
MRRLRSPVLWFFVLAYVITGVGMCVNFYALRGRLGAPISSQTMPWLPYAPYVLWAGPCLSALLMTLFLYGLPGVRRLALQLSPSSVGGAWLVLAVCLLPQLDLVGLASLVGLQQPVGGVASIADLVGLASLVGLLIVLALRGPAGIRRGACKLRPWLLGQGWPVLAACLLLPLGAVVLPVKILAAFGVGVPALQREGSPDYLYTAVISGGFLGPGLFEEIGWRGFALPHLQRRYSALVSSLILGLVWSFWHFPNFFAFTFTPTKLAIFVPMGIVLSVIYTWVYNSTGGSLFAAVVLHGATIASGKLFAGGELSDPTGVITGLLFVVIAVGLVWRYGTANLSWRDRVVAEPPDPALHNPPAASSVSGGS